MLVPLTAARPGAVEARLGLHWPIDPRPGIRLATATALRAEAGTLAPVLAGLLPALRKVLPDDPARAALGGAIRRQMRQGGDNRAGAEDPPGRHQPARWRWRPAPRRGDPDRWAATPESCAPEWRNAVPDGIRNAPILRPARRQASSCARFAPKFD